MTKSSESKDQYAQYTKKNFFSRFGLLTIIGVFTLLFTSLSRSFMTSGNWSALIVGQVAVTAVALGGITPLIAGEFDISLGYMLGFCAMMGAAVGRVENASAVAVILAVIASGIFVGLANGILTVVLKMTSMVVTLGMGLVLYGFIMGISKGRTITGGVPEILKIVAKHRFLGINLSVWLLIALGLLLCYLLEFTPFGKRMYATGLNRRAAHLSGVNTSKMKILSFMFAGFFVSIGSLILLGQAGAAMPGTGPSYLLPAYAAVFLSVTTHRPGEFNVPGLLLSVLMLAIGFNGLSLIGAPFWAESVFNGIILLVAILTTQKDARAVKIG